MKTITEFLVKKHALKPSECIEKLNQLYNNNSNYVERIKRLFDACFEVYWKSMTIEDINQFEDEDDVALSGGFGLDLEEMSGKNDTYYDLYYDVYDKIKERSFQDKMKELNILSWYYLKDKIKNDRS